MFRTTAFEEIGGFDEGTFLYEEELIVAERLRAAAWDVISVPSAVYEHIQEYSTRQIHLRACWYFIASEQHLLRRYYRWNSVTVAAVFGFRCAEFGLSCVVTAGQGLKRVLAGLVRQYRARGPMGKM
jgi:GT2 family glycosyltransferase